MAERTKLWIADTMKRLLAKKPLEKIFVAEICREAEIERPTFYYTSFQDLGRLEESESQRLQAVERSKRIFADFGSPG